MIEPSSADDIEYDVVFNNVSKEYFSGSKLSGSTKIILRKTLSVRSIYIIISGSGRIESENENGDDFAGKDDSEQESENNLNQNNSFIFKKIYLRKYDSGMNCSCSQ